MRTFTDCLPCLLRQALDAIRMVTDDEAAHEEVLRRILQDLSEIPFDQSPPAMAQRVHRRVRSLAGGADPYRGLKDRFNRLALAMYPELEQRVRQSAVPVETAVRLAIAGNVIDSGVNSHLTDELVREAVKHALAAPLEGDMARFERATAGAERILYLADNAGEIVFDRLLIEQLPRHRITVAVRGKAVINDATMDDAKAAGLVGLVEVIDSGSDAPGTIVDDCSEAFREHVAHADLVIAKGQGNYETLSETDKHIFFVLKAKCPVIANALGCPVGSLIMRESTGRRP